MDKFSFLGAVHTNMIEDLYKSYLKDESSVDSNWKNFFQGFDCFFLKSALYTEIA